MTLTQFGGLLTCHLLSLIFILMLAYREFRRVHFNFNILFTLLYLLTFYFGFPFTCLLYYQFGVSIVPAEFLFYALLSATAFYAIYYVSYKIRWWSAGYLRRSELLTINRVEAHLTWIFLAAIGMGTAALFFMQNGFLLFKLDAYNQIFSQAVSLVALKRFFYFFIPAMLICYFMHPSQRMWWAFLFTTLGFGLLTYMIVGGTRANIIIAFTLFLFIGITRGWITLWMLVTAGMAGVGGMFWLALKRYGMDLSGMEAYYTFLYLTRDTFSPWENLALLLQNYGDIEFQGLAPIVRDFYVFIPDWLWPGRPNTILNSANYFTWEVLDYHTGLAISPTLIGSLVVMGGVIFIPLGAVMVGVMIKWFDWLYEKGRAQTNRYKGAVLQAFCFGAVFNLIVLTREGMDPFISRIVFFGLFFMLSVLLAKLICWLMVSCGLLRPRDPFCWRITLSR